MRIAGLVAAGDMAIGDRVASAVGASRANDVMMRIAGLVADDTGQRYGDWRHVAMGCNALVRYSKGKGSLICVVPYYERLIKSLRYGVC